ncbi:hypothetical protein KFK09_011517 [Dendrobium nobile]|uniref:Uncharacterized protein n=1 Tax=Dendrobium nobile TaxID=94219 RepID=A0A8T3BD36_DENNO|nr:hypothetical protein KFK09_011517 [Dendrobium nobile]
MMEQRWRSPNKKSTTHTRNRRIILTKLASKLGSNQRICIFKHIRSKRKHILL